MDADLSALKFTINAAHVVSTGPVHFTQTYFLAADKDLLLRVPDLEDAVILFLMLHYIFWLEYPACCTLSMMMLKLQSSLFWLISLSHCDARIFYQELRVRVLMYDNCVRFVYL